MMNNGCRLAEAFRAVQENLNILLEAYEGLAGEYDIISQANNIPKPKKNLLRKGYSEPVFSVRKCARSKLRKKNRKTFAKICGMIAKMKKRRDLAWVVAGSLLLAEVCND